MKEYKYVKFEGIDICVTFKRLENNIEILKYEIQETRIDNILSAEQKYLILKILINKL